MPRWNPLQNAETYKDLALARRNEGRGSTVTVYPTARAKEQAENPLTAGDKNAMEIVAGWKSDKDAATDEFRRSVFPERYQSSHDDPDPLGDVWGLAALLGGGAGAGAAMLPADAQAGPSPLASLLTAIAPQQQSVSSYEPTWREKLAQLLMGNGVGSQARRDFVSGVTGSTGLGQTGMGLVDMTPAGVPLGVQEAYRENDPQGMALAAAPFGAARRALPGIGNLLTR